MDLAAGVKSELRALGVKSGDLIMVHASLRKLGLAKSLLKGEGEMSLVGPRPLLMQYLDRYTPEQARRHDVRPGLTGWAQVNGRNALSWEDKFALDTWYVDNRSFWLDLRIMAMTAWQIVRPRGISAEGEATMSEFMGTSPPSPPMLPLSGQSE